MAVMPENLRKHLRSVGRCGHIFFAAVRALVLVAAEGRAAKLVVVPAAGDSGETSRVVEVGEARAEIVNRQSRGRSVSRVLFPPVSGRRSFIWTSRCRLALPFLPWRRSASGGREATYPPAERPRPLVPGPSTACADRLLGLAGGGVCPAGDVAAAAVRSYRTISPLPVPLRAIGCVFSVALSLGSPGPVSVDGHATGTGSRWPLATTVPCPARTFLRRLRVPHAMVRGEGPSHRRRPPDRPWD